MQQVDYATVHNTIKDVVANPSGGDDSSIRKTLKLIRNSLRLHSEGVGQVTNTHLARKRQIVEELQSRVIGENFEQILEFRRRFVRERCFSWENHF